MDSLISRQTDADAINDLNSIATWYTKLAKRQPMDRVLRKTTAFLKINGLKAVPFDKGVGYCIMTERDYHERLRGVLTPPQFVESRLCGTQKKPVVLQIEEKFNKTLAQLKHRGSIDTDFNKVRSSGGRPARLYGLAKVHKKDTPLRPVLSLPGSCYEPVTNELAKWFEKLPEAQIETSSSKIKAEITAATLDDDEVMLSLDVKSFYTNVPVEESIEFAADLVYSRDVVPDFSRATFVELLKLAVQNVHILCDSKWYVQVDGLAMGSKLAVYLANIWMKQFEDVISGRGSFTTPGRTQSAPDPGGSVIVARYSLWLVWR